MNPRLHTIIIFILLFLINSIAVASKSQCQASCCNKQVETASCCSKSLQGHHALQATNQGGPDQPCPFPGACLSSNHAQNQFPPATTQHLSDLNPAPQTANSIPLPAEKPRTVFRAIPPPHNLKPPFYTLHCSLLN